MRQPSPHGANNLDCQLPHRAVQIIGGTHTKFEIEHCDWLRREAIAMAYMATADFQIVEGWSADFTRRWVFPPIARCGMARTHAHNVKWSVFHFVYSDLQ